LNTISKPDTVSYAGVNPSKYILKFSQFSPKLNQFTVTEFCWKLKQKIFYGVIHIWRHAFFDNFYSPPPIVMLFSNTVLMISSQTQEPEDPRPERQNSKGAKNLIID